MGFADRLKEFAVYSSCHGIPHIATARSWPIRLFWSIIVVVATVLVIVDIKQLYHRYQQHPKIVQSEIKFEQLPFPAVTVCNLNPIRKSQVHLVPQLEQLLAACDLPVDKNRSSIKDQYCKIIESRLSSSRATSQMTTISTTTLVL